MRTKQQQASTTNVVIVSDSIQAYIAVGAHVYLVEMVGVYVRVCVCALVFHGGTHLHIFIDQLHDTPKLQRLQFGTPTHK